MRTYSAESSCHTFLWTLNDNELKKECDHPQEDKLSLPKYVADIARARLCLNLIIIMKNYIYSRGKYIYYSGKMSNCLHSPNF